MKELRTTLNDGIRDQQNVFSAAMSSNGNGLLPKYVDAEERQGATTGTLILKNGDGTYRTVDLPFNCSSRVAITNGQMFCCGNKIFSLGPNDSIQGLQDLAPLSFQSGGFFVSNSILMRFTSSWFEIWTNSTTGSWTKQLTMGFSTSPPRFSTNIIASLEYVPYGQSPVGAVLWKRLDDDLFWTEVGRAPLNITWDENFANVVVWDGGNTIIVGWPANKVGFNTMSGRIQIFRKQNGAWGLNKVITSEDLDLPAPGGLGIGLYPLDDNTVIVHAVASNRHTRRLNGGMAFALEKIANDWVITKKFVQQNNDDAYLVGALNYDKSDGRLYFSACSLRVTDELYYRACGIKYAVWNRSG